MKSLLKIIQYDMLDFIEGEVEPCYSSNDVTSCIKLLLEFMSSIDLQKQTKESAKAHVRELVLSLNELNNDCQHCLIDTAQREGICEFIHKALLAANICFDNDITEEWRNW